MRCLACPSGKFSAPLIDSLGSTYICEACPVGTSQPSGGQQQCQPCGQGEYQDETGQYTCKRCPLGFYEDRAALSAVLLFDVISRSEVPIQETEGARVCTQHLGKRVSWLHKVRMERRRALVPGRNSHGVLADVPSQVPHRQPHAWPGLLLRY